MTKEERKEYNRKWYLKHREQVINATMSRQRPRQKDNRLKLIEYLKEHPCVDCKESDPVVLEFDHDKGKKEANVGSLIQNASWERVLIEIAKCSVRCANCHRRRTAKQRKWLKAALNH